ncbi:apolipoprotein F [Tenrec ecaudatus]|uniref:apolipoprotein F n=1 Tax=Tenrec ecaudatus TaxID=94439 RepID=UPI003F597F82
MGGFRPVIPAALLLCSCLLGHVSATSYGTQAKTLRSPPSVGTQPPFSDSLLCQTLLPKSLPGFTYMAPLPRFLVGLALSNALENAGCQAYGWSVKRQLYRLGGVRATQLLIHHLQGPQRGGSVQKAVSLDALILALHRLAGEQPGPERARRSLHPEDCEQEQEETVHSILRWVPNVGTYYNLGTALYYATQNCTDKAKERGQEGAMDLGYDLLMTMAGLSGGPTGLVVSSALKPAVKAGVQQLIQYFYEKERTTPVPATSQEYW